VNLKQLEERVRTILDEPDKMGYFSSAEIRDWLNEGLEDITVKAKHLKHTAYYDIQNGVEWYELPGNLIEIFKVFFKDIPLTEIPLEDKGKSHVSGYIIWGDAITLIPLEDGKLTLYYYRKPAEMKDNEDEPELSRAYHNLLIEYTLSRAKQKDERYDEAQINYQKYLQDLQDLIRQVSRAPRRKQIKVVRR